MKALIPSPLPPVPAIQWTVELQAIFKALRHWVGFYQVQGACMNHLPSGLSLLSACYLNAAG